MNKTLGISLIVVVVLVLATGSFMAGTIYARSNAFGPGWMMGNYANKNADVPGGMMNMMGNNTDPSSMMGGKSNNNANHVPVTVDQAKAAAEEYLANLKNEDLKIAEIMIFDNNAYVVVKEASTGLGAFELLVDSPSQSAYPEHGPNMMWNLKYGALNHQSMMENNSGMMSMMGGNNGMMNGYTWNDTTSADVSPSMTISPDRAIQLAQKYLDKNIVGATASSDPIQFYGYYTLDFERDGKAAGMLSVNGFSGQVFLHSWHSSFIEETELK